MPACFVIMLIDFCQITFLLQHFGPFLTRGEWTYLAEKCLSLFKVMFLCSPPPRTPLHCAASCNSVHLCKMLVESGAAIFATTISDVETAADKCEEMEEGYTQCSQFLYGRYIDRQSMNVRSCDNYMLYSKQLNLILTSLCLSQVYKKSWVWWTKV